MFRCKGNIQVPYREYHTKGYISYLKQFSLQKQYMIPILDCSKSCLSMANLFRRNQIHDVVVNEFRRCRCMH